MPPAPPRQQLDACGRRAREVLLGLCTDEAHAEVFNTGPDYVWYSGSTKVVRAAGFEAYLASGAADVEVVDAVGSGLVLLEAPGDTYHFHRKRH